MYKVIQIIKSSNKRIQGYVVMRGKESAVVSKEKLMELLKDGKSIDGVKLCRYKGKEYIRVTSNVKEVIKDNVEIKKEISKKREIKQENKYYVVSDDYRVIDAGFNKVERLGYDKIKEMKEAGIDIEYTTTYSGGITTCNKLVNALNLKAGNSYYVDGNSVAYGRILKYGGRNVLDIYCSEKRIGGSSRTEDGFVNFDCIVDTEFNILFKGSYSAIKISDGKYIGLYFTDGGIYIRAEGSGILKNKQVMKWVSEVSYRNIKMNRLRLISLYVNKKTNEVDGLMCEITMEGKDDGGEYETTYSLVMIDIKEKKIEEVRHKRWEQEKKRYHEIYKGTHKILGMFNADAVNYITSIR